MESMLSDQGSVSVDVLALELFAVAFSAAAAVLMGASSPCASEAASANGEPLKSIDAEAMAVSETVPARRAVERHACLGCFISTSKARGGGNISLIFGVLRRTCKHY